MNIASATIEVLDILPSYAADAMQGFRTPNGFETVAASWSLLVQSSNIGRVTLQWVVVHQEADVRAVGIVYIVHRLAIGDYVGGILDWVTSACRRIGYVPLSFDIAYLEVPFSNREGLLFAPDVDANERAALTRGVLEVLDRILPVDAICIKETAGHPKSCLEHMGLAVLPFLDSHVLELQGSVRSSTNWLAARSSSRRSSIRRNVRCFEGAGAVLKTVNDPAADAQLLAELYQRVAAQARRNGELPLPMNVSSRMFEEYHGYLGGNGVIRVAHMDGMIVGFTMLLFGHDTLFLRFIGLDYERSHACRAYFRLLYDAVDAAVERGLRFVDMGTTAAHVKEPLGCQPISTIYRIRFRRRLRPIGGLLTALLKRRFNSVISTKPSL